MIHFLKIAPKYFSEVYTGRKMFEVRDNDRGFQVGDIVVLCEGEKGTFSKRTLPTRITYILDDPSYVKEGFVVFSFNAISYTEALNEIASQELKK